MASQIGNILAIDQGTTNTKVLLVNPGGRVIARAARPLRQSYPQPAWVEQDATAIWQSVHEAIEECLAAVDDPRPAAIAITNQRESVVLWERQSGRPVSPVIVWQCRRTADFCSQLRARGLESFLAERTGLGVDPLFSASKMNWMLDHIADCRRRAELGELCLGTMDSWVLWNLTGGQVHACDVTNASRTQLFDIHKLDWGEDLLALFGVPRVALPEVRPSNADFGSSVALGRLPAGVPIVALIGDSHAALFGQAGFHPGSVKATYGTGSSLITPTSAAVLSKRGLSTTIAWALAPAHVTYALEGNISVAGAVVQWLGEFLDLENSAEEVARLAERVESAGGLYLVPAFVGLGAPYWNDAARGLISGITHGSTAAHLARAAIEAIAYQVRDVFDVMQIEAGADLNVLLADGGASRNTMLMQFQADIIGRPLLQNASADVSALGAVYLAGLATGQWQSLDEITQLPRPQTLFEPRMTAADREALYAGWQTAVARALLDSTRPASTRVSHERSTNLSTPSYRDPNASVEERAENLLSLMTLDEKLAQLGCLWSTSFVSTGTFDPDAVAEKMLHGIGQVTRIGASTGLHPEESAAFMNAIQQVAVERTRLGIPVIVHEESTGGFCHRDATVFPQGIGLAATWDPDLVKQVAGAIRIQMLAVGARQALAPVLDIARDPRWGRVEETYGEDPVLTGTIGTAYVQGLQSDDLRNGVAATAKHFLGYSMSEGGRNWGPVQMGPRELREVYAEPFAAVIRNAGLATIMNSYASVDGLPCAGSPAILTELLRDELGFAGVVVADYASVLMLMDYHRVAATPGEAARLALCAGLDMELPAVECYGAPLKAEIEAGRVPLEVVDMAVRRVLRLKFQLGLFEYPYADAEAANAAFQTPEQRALARQAVAASTILLTNDGVLPLAPTVKRVAVIGPGADDERLLQGDYHYPAHLEVQYAAPESVEVTGLLVPRAAGNYATGPYFTPHITPLAGLRAALGNEVEIRYTKGCEVLGDDRSGFAEAMQVARNADVAVVVVAGRSGLLRSATVGEGNDATDLDLTGVQEELVEALAETGTPLVVMVLSGRIHTLASVAKRANALLQVFPPGEEGGTGLADVLTGEVNPSGRLPVSLPRSVGQVPNHVGLRAGGDHPMFYGDYIDAPTSPLFAFGHGLSYTSFAYRNLTVQATSTTEPIEVSIEVCNTGERAGFEVVQLYCRDEVASVARPDRMLLGFARLSLTPGQARRVTFIVHPSRLAFYDPCMRFVTEPGAYTFSIGASSADIRAEKTIVLSGQVAEYKQREILATEACVA